MMSNKIFDRIQCAIVETVGLSDDTFETAKRAVQLTDYIPVSFYDLNLKNYNDEKYNIVYSRYLNFLVQLYNDKIDDIMFIDEDSNTINVNKILIPKNKYASVINDNTLPPSVMKMLNFRLSESEDIFNKYYQITDTEYNLNMHQKKILYDFYIGRNQYNKKAIGEILDRVKSLSDLDTTSVKLNLDYTDRAAIKNIVEALRNLRNPADYFGDNFGKNLYEEYRILYSKVKKSFDVNSYFSGDLTASALDKLTTIFALGNEAMQKLKAGSVNLQQLVQEAKFTLTLFTEKFTNMVQKIQEYKNLSVTNRLYDPYLFNLYANLYITIIYYNVIMTSSVDAHHLEYLYSTAKLIQFTYTKLKVYFENIDKVITNIDEITDGSDFYEGHKIKHLLVILSMLKRINSNPDPNLLSINPGILLNSNSGAFDIREVYGIINTIGCGKEDSGDILDVSSGPMNDDAFIKGIPPLVFLEMMSCNLEVIKYLDVCYYIFLKYKDDDDNVYFSEYQKYGGKPGQIISFCFYPRLINNDTTLASFIGFIKDHIKSSKRSSSICHMGINKFNNVPASYHLGMTEEGIDVFMNNLEKIKLVTCKSEREKYFMIIAWFIYCIEKYATTEHYHNFDINGHDKIDHLYRTLKDTLNINPKRFNKEDYYRRGNLDKYFNPESLNKLFNFIMYYIKRTGGSDDNIFNNIFELNIDEENYKFKTKLQELYENNEFNPENIAQHVPHYALISSKIFNNINETFKNARINSDNQGFKGGFVKDIEQLFNDSIQACEEIPYNDEAAFQQYVCDRVKIFREGFDENEFMTSKGIEYLLTPFGSAKDNLLNSIRNDKMKIQGIGNVSSQELFQKYFSDVFFNLTLIKNRSFNIPETLKCLYTQMLVSMYEFLICSYTTVIYTQAYNSFTKLFENSNRLIDSVNADKNIMLDDSTMENVIRPAIQKKIDNIKKNLMKSVTDILNKLNTLSNNPDGKALYDKADIEDILQVLREINTKF